MAKYVLPTDPTTGAIDIAALLDLHRTIFGDARMDGEAGNGGEGGSGSGGGSGEGGAGSEGSGSGGGSGGNGGQGSDAGFPANTPLEQMTADQREAYWKHQARKHEDRVKAFGGLTPEKIAELRDKADRHDALERELMSDKDKAVAEAKDTAKAEARAELIPQLVRARFEAVSAGRIELERLDTLLEPLDLSKFLDADGNVDTDKVKAFVDGVAPDKGNEGRNERRGPSANGLGSRNGSATSGPSVATGRDLYRNRRGRTPTTAS